MAEKMRVHILANELNVASKDIITKCRAEGIDTVKNHMSTLSAGLHATIIEWFSEGSQDSALETAKPVDLKKVRAAASKRKRKSTKKQDTAPDSEEPEVAAEASTMVATEVAAGRPLEAVAVGEPAMSKSGAATTSEVLPVAEVTLPVSGERAGTAPVDESSPAMSGSSVVTVEPPTDEGPAPPTDDLEKPESEEPAEKPKREQVAPAGPQHVPAPAKLQGPRVVRYEAPEEDRRPPRRDVPASRVSTGGGLDVAPPSGTTPDAPSKTGKPAAGRIADQRRSRINPRRAASSLREAGEKFAEWRDRDLQERRERLAGATGRRILQRRSTSRPTGAVGRAVPVGPVTKATVNEPVRMKAFCSETGLSLAQLFKVLRDEHGLMANINMTLETETAQLLSLHFGIELTVVPAKTLLDDVMDEFAAIERKNLKPRPPIVTMLGHVDHGKTSLLDAIRKTRIAAGEDGGITQHISSYHMETSHGAVTFLDTPGHEAFTAMRARGAQLTDVVVLVVAADDGVMPQTIEAIHHAKSANVAIVVALNKIDLGTQNKLKIYGQLTEHGLTPSGEWGGEIDVIETSATTGQGIDDLVEHLAELSHLLELQADPTIPASGAVIEAKTKAGVGAVIQVLVQDGTLKVGRTIVCGNAAGKVRALLNDRGERIQEAGPAMPVEVWGLDEVPSSGDKFFELNRLQRAKDVAAEMADTRLKKGRQQSRRVATLQELLKQRDTDEAPELNLIIKGDVDGSVTALKHVLAGIPSDEVRLTIRHSGVGQVNDSDILLAATCRGIVVAFRVDISAGSRRLGDQHGVDVRTYRVIYDVGDDIKKALEGLLTPLETIEHRATAEVREVFRLSRKGGVIAGSIVTAGSLVRDQLVKITRDGVIVREGAKIASLRRFKDDVKDVRSGMECGIRVEDFDDIHVGDVIETYVIVKTARTL